jgi:signal transduction histidine kinase
MLQTLRTRLLLGIVPLLAITIGIGVWAVVMFHRLGGNIDVILRENYRSVLAAQNMKEALERMDSAVLFAIGGQEERAKEQFREHKAAFEKNLTIEAGNVTLPGEGDLVDALKALFGRYLDLSDRYFSMDASDVEGRTSLYFSELEPTFQRIKDRADDVLNLNQRNMEEMDRRARAAAATSMRWMALTVFGAAALGTLIAVVLSRSILEPIRAVTYAAQAMARGEYDQVVPVPSRDELGQLADAFNTMARRIREFQQAGTARLLRAQKTAQATIDSFPDPVVVVDPEGSVERANPAARRLLGVVPVAGTPASWQAPDGLRAKLSGVLRGESDYLPTSFENVLPVREDGQERSLLPRILAIRDQSDGMLGAAVVLTDVTKFRLLDQLKSDMVSTVSHELKTPLTGVQMVVHLLLEEAVGPLNAKQVELLLAARQDSDRLLAMVNDLLDLTRIEQGRLSLRLGPEDPARLVRNAVERFGDEAKEAGIALEAEAPAALPRVSIDGDRLDHVFDNLIANALKYTPRGGRVVVSARPESDAVAFAVSDTGAGIAPEHLTKVFDRFYRVPGSRPGGAGLGLAIVREIVEAHGGRIDVESVLGSGTTFTFRLPLAWGDSRSNDGAQSHG